MTAAQLAQDIGRTAVLRSPQPIRFNVTITDARVSFGRVQYQITPVSGAGRVWVDGSTLDLTGPQDLG